MGDRLMRRRDVEEITGLSRSSIYRKMDDGTFPRSVRVTSGSVRWRRSDIMDWMESLPVTGGELAHRGTSAGDGQRPWRGRPRTQRGVRYARVTYRGLSAFPKRRKPHGTSPYRSATALLGRRRADRSWRVRRRPRSIPAPVVPNGAGMAGDRIRRRPRTAP